MENRAGAAGTLAMPVLQQAAPDGYTIAQLPQPVFRAPHVRRAELWDPIRDTTPILQVSGVTFGMVVPAGSPLAQRWTTCSPGRASTRGMTVATNGVGTTPHVGMDELFARRGLSYVHVPYKGTAEQMIAVSSGQVMVGVNSNGFAPFVDNGKLRLLVTFGEHRTRRWPKVPTLRELGHGIVAQSPYGLAGPSGLPPAVVAPLHDAFSAAMNDPAHVAELAKRYDQERYLGPDDSGRSVRETYAAERRTCNGWGSGLPDRSTPAVAPTPSMRRSMSPWSPSTSRMPHLWCRPCDHRRRHAPSRSLISVTLSPSASTWPLASRTTRAASTSGAASAVWGDHSWAHSGQTSSAPSS